MPVTSKGYRFERVAVLLFSNLKRKKKSWQRKKTHIYPEQILFSEKKMYNWTWNPPSNSALPSRTEKAVIKLLHWNWLILAVTVKDQDAALQLYTHTSSSSCSEKVCRAVTAQHNCPFLPCSFRTLQGAWDSVPIGAHQVLVHRSSEGKNPSQTLHWAANAVESTVSDEVVLRLETLLWKVTLRDRKTCGSFWKCESRSHEKQE